MQDTHNIAFLSPLAVGIAAVICTIFIHALPLSATINFIRRQERCGRVGVGFWTDTVIVARVILYALVAHLLEIAFWAVLFVICGEFSDFDTACYHSAGQLHILGLWRYPHESCLETAGPAGNGRRNASLRGIDRIDFYRHSTVV